MWIARRPSDAESDEMPALQSSLSESDEFWETTTKASANKSLTQEEYDIVHQLFGNEPVLNYTCVPPAGHVEIGGKTIHGTTARLWTFELQVKYKQSHQAVRELHLQRVQRQITDTFNDILTTVGL